METSCLWMNNCLIWGKVSVVAMDGKVLIFVKDYQLKRKILNSMIELGLSFVECFEEEELSFKMQLFNTTPKIYIYEFIPGADDKQFTKLKQIKEKGWKIIVIFPTYLIEYIDKSQEARIDDLIILPLENQTVRNKLLTLLNIPTVEKQVTIEEVKGENAQLKEINEVVENEINRAKRGKYDLSFVMIDLGNSPIDFQKDYTEVLVKVLRETDIMIQADEKNHYLLICPFTPKNYLVEVENKIRKLYDKEKIYKKMSDTLKIYVYGLTLGDDGEDFDELYKHLLNRMHESKLFDQTYVQNMIYTPEKLKAYKTMYKRYQ